MFLLFLYFDEFKKAFVKKFLLYIIIIIIIIIIYNFYFFLKNLPENSIDPL